MLSASPRVRMTEPLPQMMLSPDARPPSARSAVSAASSTQRRLSSTMPSATTDYGTTLFEIAIYRAIRPISTT